MHRERRRSLGWWRPWSRDQQLALLNHLGVAGAAKLKREVGGGRTEKAILSKAWREYGTARLTRGTYSLREALRETGYDASQLHRAQRALRQRWHRTRIGGRFMISLAQLDEMISWLRSDYWAKQYALYGCVWCTTETRPQKSHGLCDRCYYRYRRRCRAYSLPTTHNGMVVFVQRCLEKSECDTISALAERLKGGLALTQRQLELLGKRYGTDG